MTPAASAGGERRRGARARLPLGLACAALFALFAALGTWQVQRRAWKLDLIARVESRVHAPPVPAPARDRWAAVNRADDEYRHVRLDGRFLYDRETRVQAVSALGAGYWVLTPLQRDDGSIVLVNRGFVAPERRDRAARPDEPPGTVAVTGLLRLSEPGGGFLRHNDPPHERWYSRDVAAIAAARGLAGVAPYFVDADARPGAPGDAPVGGLTVVSFYNNHLVYAITWYALALMSAAAGWRLWRAEPDARGGAGGD